MRKHSSLFLEPALTEEKGLTTLSPGQQQQVGETGGQEQMTPTPPSNLENGQASGGANRCHSHQTVIFLSQTIQLNKLECLSSWKNYHSQNVRNTFKRQTV
jgi:hypothetical protein